MIRHPLVILATLLIGSSIFAESFRDGRKGQQVDAPVSEFAATSIGTVTVGLQWKAPNAQDWWDEDGSGFYDGPAERYELRYSTSTPGTDFVFNSMTPATSNLPSPADRDTLQDCTVTELTQGTDYWFVIRTWFHAAYEDSAVVHVKTITDDVLPGTIDDLTASVVAPYSVILTWTAPGDDHSTGAVPTGAATSYQLAYSTAGPITTTSDFIAATPADYMPTPEIAGTAQGKRVEGLAPGTSYWFAIRAIDEVGNKGALSATSLNVTTTTIPPGSEGSGGGCAQSAVGTGGAALLAVLAALVFRRTAY